MRRMVNSTYVSLDGVIEHLEKWHFDYLDEDAHALIWDQLSASDAVLMGRKSYEGHAEAWPGRTGDFADKVNAMEKYVVSTTMSRAEWNNTTVIDGDLVEQVTELKRKPGRDILMHEHQTASLQDPSASSRCSALARRVEDVDGSADVAGAVEPRHPAALETRRRGDHPVLPR
jgi:RibD C-terminal domain